MAQAGNRMFLRMAARWPLTVELLAVYYCARDSRTPLKVKLTLLGAAAYFLLPLDLIPDLFGLLGFTDDVAVIWLLLRGVRPFVTDEHRQRARAALDGV